MSAQPDPEERLRALAQAATQGERFVNKDNEIVVRVSPDHPYYETWDGNVPLCVTDSGHYPPDLPDAEFMAACSPAVIISLLDEVQRLRASLAEAEQDSKRLDWIDETGASVIPAWSGDGSRIGVVAAAFNSRVVRRKTAREAIDAASLHTDTP